MKTGFKFGCVITVFVFLMSLPFVAAAIYCYEKENNPCIRIQHSKAVSGQVALKSGGFGAGRVMYILYYPGTHQRSGIECKYAAYVTESEYNRQMYGDK